MYMDELRAAISSIIAKHDPYRASKLLHLKNWCEAFLILFSINGRERLPFFIDILSDEECWEQSDTIHRIKLKRRATARKIVQSESPRGIENPLEHYERYIVSCWCCLEDDIIPLFDFFLEHSDMRNGKKLVKFFSTDYLANPLTAYWSYVVGGFASELELGRKHLYEQGLDFALDMYTGYVEAIEWFWDKIEALPEDEMSAQKKNEIFMRTTVSAAGTKFSKHPEILEFCVSQITPKNYLQLLKRDIRTNYDFGSLVALRDNLRFDIFRNMFDCFLPNNISERRYLKYLTLLEIEFCWDYYICEAAKLFMHIWTKEGFDRHRAYVLTKEMKDVNYRGTLLIPFVKKKHMEPVWAVLDKASPNILKVFMICEKAVYICSVLRERRDEAALKKFLSYKSRAFENQSIGHGISSYAKKPRVE